MDNNQLVRKQPRLVGLDVFRIVSALMIFLFHSAGHLGCDYGVFQEFVQMGAIFMTGFFLLSGYSLYYVHGCDDFTSLHTVKSFYAKRAVGILPLYFATALLYILFLGTESPIENVVLAPVELLGIQSVFVALDQTSHNGGTWFVSCILLCYLVFPFATLCIRQMSEKGKWGLLGLCSFILLYSPFVRRLFELHTIYGNPFFRILEFTIGVILAACKMNTERFRFLYTKRVCLLESILLFIGVTIAFKLGIAQYDYMLYSWVGLPAFCLMMLSLSHTKWPRLQNARVLTYLSAITYSFFLAQFFVWPLVRKVGIHNNVVRILVAFMVCFVIAAVFHACVEKPCKRVLTIWLFKSVRK